MSTELAVMTTFSSSAGHSLTLIQVRSQLSQRHGFELPVQAFFENRTLHLLAERMIRSGSGNDSTKESRLGAMRDIMLELGVDSHA